MNIFSKFGSLFNRRASEKTVLNNKNFISKAVGFLTKNYGAYFNRKPEYEQSEYDFEEIDRAFDTDSYVSKALGYYSRLIFKAGYKIDGKDKNVKYIKDRFKVMGLYTGKPMDILFLEIADDIYKYSNCFLIKSREDYIPNIKAKGYNKDKTVVGGYYRVDPYTIKIKRNINGKILSYKQIVNGKEKKYKPEDIIHIYMDKKGNFFGRPWITPALDDVRMLRRVEGNVLGIIYRFFFPIYQYIVGLPEKSANKGEVDEAIKTVESAPLEGVIVTNERTKIKVVDDKSSILDASGYLAYFEQRVFTALNVSSSIMGRGGAKQDASSMESQAHDVVKYVQKIIASFITTYIVNDLLIEGGFNPIFNDLDEVSFKFFEISLETKIKQENHDMLKYQSGISTLTETRRKLGLSEEVDINDLYTNVGNGDGTSQGDTTSRNMPTNQYGTTSVKARDSISHDINKKCDSFESYKEKYKGYLLKQKYIDKIDSRSNSEDFIKFIDVEELNAELFDTVFDIYVKAEEYEMNVDDCFDIFKYKFKNI